MRDFKSFSNQFFKCNTGIIFIYCWWIKKVFWQKSSSSIFFFCPPFFCFFLTNEKFSCDSIQNKQNQNQPFFFCFLLLFEKTTLIYFFSKFKISFSSQWYWLKGGKFCSYLNNNTLLKKKKIKVKTKKFLTLKKRKSWPEKKSFGIFLLIWIELIYDNLDCYLLPHHYHPNHFLCFFVCFKS